MHTGFLVVDYKDSKAAASIVKKFYDRSIRDNSGKYTPEEEDLMEYYKSKSAGDRVFFPVLPENEQILKQLHDSTAKSRKSKYEPEYDPSAQSEASFKSLGQHWSIMPDNKKLLYEQAVKSGKYSKSFEDFSAQFSTSDSQAKLWEQARNDGMYSKSFEDFQQQFFSDSPTQITPPTGYSWGSDEKKGELSQGSYGTSVEKVDMDNVGVAAITEEIKQDEALKVVRKNRGGDYSTTADVRSREGMSEYDLSRNERRSPMEKMMWKAFGGKEGETTMAQHNSDLSALAADVGPINTIGEGARSTNKREVWRSCV